MPIFYEAESHRFQAISRQVEAAIASLSAGEWQDFLIAVEVFEGSRRSGRPHGRVVSELDDDFFVLDGTVFGGRQRYICTRRGRDVLVAHVVGRRRRVGRRDIAAAKAALTGWTRTRARRRPDARDG